MARHRQRRHIGDDPAEDALDRRRLAVAYGVGEEDRIGTGLGDLDGDPAYPVLVDRPLDRAAKGGGEPASDARAFLCRRGVAERSEVRARRHARAVAGRTGVTETKFCDEASDQLPDRTPEGAPDDDPNSLPWERPRPGGGLVPAATHGIVSFDTARSR